MNGEMELSKPGFYCMRCAARVDRGDVIKPFENMQNCSHAHKDGKICGGNVIEIKKHLIPTGKLTIDFQAWQSRDNMKGIAWALLMDAEDPNGEYLQPHFREDHLDLLLKVVNEVLMMSKRLTNEGVGEK